MGRHASPIPARQVVIGAVLSVVPPTLATVQVDEVVRRRPAGLGLTGAELEPAVVPA